MKIFIVILKRKWLRIFYEKLFNQIYIQFFILTVIFFKIYHFDLLEETNE